MTPKTSLQWGAWPSLAARGEGLSSQLFFQKSLLLGAPSGITGGFPRKWCGCRYVTEGNVAEIPPCFCFWISVQQEGGKGMELPLTEPLGGHRALCPGFLHLFQLGPECTLRQAEPLQLCVTEHNSHCLQQKKKHTWGGHHGWLGPA